MRLTDVKQSALGALQPAGEVKPNAPTSVAPGGTDPHDDAWSDAAGSALAPGGTPTAGASPLTMQLQQRTSDNLGALIRDALADKHLSKDEWAVLGSMVNILPLMAGPECRLLLQVFGADHTLDVSIRNEVINALRSRGYPVPRGFDPKPIDVEATIAKNVTELDVEFDALCRALGLPDQPQLVGVLDGGFDVSHPALHKLEGAPHTDFSQGGLHGADDSHGTHVAAIATQGTPRLAPLCMNVLAVDAAHRSLELRGFRDAVEHAVKQGVRVMNVSILTTDPGEVEQVRGAVLAHPEVLFVLGAGNNPMPLGEGKFAPELHVGAQPFPNVCVVTSARDGKLAGYAAYGGTTAIAAEGDVHSAVPKGFAFMSGTSMAAPQVTSVAARCLLLDPRLDPARVQRILQLSVDKSDALASVVTSGGALNGTRACRLTALARLTREGATLEGALKKLAIVGEERALLTALLRELDG